MDAARAPLLLALVLLAGCLQFPGSPDETDPGRAGEAAPAACTPVDEATRLSAWRLGPQRQGHRPCAEVPRGVQLAFQVEAINTGDHTAAKASPVALDGDWLVAGDTGELHRVRADGEIAWTAETEPSRNGIHGTPAVANGTAYVGAYDGRLYAFDLANGEEIWRTKLGGSIGASPLVHDGLVYIAVETPEPSGLVSVVNASTGEEVFRDERITDHPHSSIALSEAEDRFVVGANDGRVYAWNASTFEHTWTFATDGPVKGPIAIHEDGAVFGSWDGSVYRVDLATGEEDWSYPTEGEVMAGAAVDEASDTIVVPSYDDHVYALDARQGTLVWRTDVGGSTMSSPLLADGLVLVGSHDASLWALDARDGDPVWRFPADDKVTSSPAVHDERVAFTTFAGETSGKLFVLE